MARRRTSADQELAALRAILIALEPLDGDSIQRVLDYVLNRLSISQPGTKLATATGISPVAADTSNDAPSRRRISIRDLANEKRPESSNQMAALVAYYLSEVAEEAERKETINTADISRYFKQAAFRLPKAPKSALPNAAAAGYFDSVGNGLYRLNAVGYNLIAHGLPRSASPNTSPKRRTRSRSSTIRKSKSRSRTSRLQRAIASRKA
jgi:hypothetical protein